MGADAVEDWASWTVEAVLARCPSCAMAFVRHRTACAGCTLARFCTLRDVAASYAIPLADLVATLEQHGLAATSATAADEPGSRLAGTVRGASR